MALTLSNVMQSVYTKLGHLRVGLAEGGTATTALTDISGGNKGTLFVVETTDNAAPEGEFSEVSAFSKGATYNTFTTVGTLGAAVGSGDMVAYAGNTFPTYLMVELVNKGLSALGYIDLVDTTTLDSAANQTEYACAVAWKHPEPFRVDVQTNTTDANDNKWVKLAGWEYIPATAGSTGLLVFDYQLPSTRDLRIWYQDKHPRLNSYSDAVYEALPEELVIAAVWRECARYRARGGSGSARAIQYLHFVETEFDRIEMKFPLEKQRRRSRLFVGDLMGNSGDYDPGPDKVRL